MTNTYLFLKSLHILGVILFLGNIIITAWWKTMADRTKQSRVVAYAQRQVTLTDIFFTAGGALLILITGILNAHLLNMDYWHIHWLAGGLWLFIISGIIWVLILIPIQIKQARIARSFAEGSKIPGMYWSIGQLWTVFGIIATILPMINLYLMVFKPT
jgi:uncharacterized membrane protein